MPMKNPSHPGLGVRENLFGPSWAWRYRGGGGSGGGSSYPFAGLGRPRRGFRPTWTFDWRRQDGPARISG